MGQYRVELSPNNRAGCKDKECLAKGVKILKGEVRFASMIEIKEHTSWVYKHWGCVTPKQISNLKTAIEDNTDLLDGYDEVPEDIQEKIRRTLEQGHVDDDDWKGDLELNRPGQSGAHKRTSKKDTAEGEAEDTVKSKVHNSLKSPTTKKRGRAKAEDAVEDPAPKKAKISRKKVLKDNADVEAENAEVESIAPKKTKATRAKKESVDHPAETLELAQDETAAGSTGKGRGPGTKARSGSTKKANQQDKGIVNGASIDNLTSKEAHAGEPTLSSEGGRKPRKPRAGISGESPDAEVPAETSKVKLRSGRKGGGTYEANTSKTLKPKGTPSSVVPAANKAKPAKKHDKRATKP